MRDSRQSPQPPIIGYLVSAWPRLSETFVLNEVLGIERLGTALRIFSLKEPAPGPAPVKAREVRAPLTCLAEARRWARAVGPNLRVLCRHPLRYFRVLGQARRYRRTSGGHRFLEAVGLADTLARNPVTHLHAHFANAPAVVAMFVNELTGIPYTFTAHAKDLYVKTPRPLLRAEVQRAQAVITCTEYNRRFIRQQAGLEHAAKLHCFYHGIDLSEFGFPWPRAGVEDPPVILSVARLVEKKGLGELVGAARILKARGYPFRVEIIGDGPLRPSLEHRVADLGLHDCVRLRGALPHEEVRAAYRRARVFALPCVVAADGDRDGIPNVLLEAMASGVPVVSTPVSGIPELVEAGRDGLLVDPASVEALAEAIASLLRDGRLSERLARAARAKIEASFSVHRNCAQLLPLLLKETPEKVHAKRARRGALEGVNDAVPEETHLTPRHQGAEAEERTSSFAERSLAP